MQKIKMARGVSFTFEEGCNKYLENCRQKNLREGTIEHYRQSYVQFYKFFDPKMPIEDIDEQSHKDYVLHLKATLDRSSSILFCRYDVWLCRHPVRSVCIPCRRSRVRSQFVLRRIPCALPCENRGADRLRSVREHEFPRPLRF